MHGKNFSIFTGSIQTFHVLIKSQRFRYNFCSEVQNENVDDSLYDCSEQIETVPDAEIVSSDENE